MPSGFLCARQVLLGHPYDVAIDMWSLGCMAAELFLGLPLFPGACEHDLLCHIVDMLGAPPHHVLSVAAHTSKYFRCLEEATKSGERRARYHVRSCNSALLSMGLCFAFPETLRRARGCPASRLPQEGFWRALAAGPRVRPLPRAAAEPDGVLVRGCTRLRCYLQSFDA